MLPALNIYSPKHSPKPDTKPDSFFRNRLFILCPGYLDSKDYSHLTLLGKDLTHLGATALSFDPIGTWQSDGDISEYTITQYQKTLKDLIDHAEKTLNIHEIVLVGHSMGGYNALVYTPTDARVKAVVAIMTPPTVERADNLDRIQLWKSTGKRDSIRDMPDDQTSTKAFTVPVSYLDDSGRFDVSESISQISVPSLYIAGNEDIIVTPVEMRKLYESANQPKTYTLISEIDHDYRKNKGAIRKVNRAIIRGLKEFGNLSRSLVN